MAEDPNLVKVELRGDDGEVETLWAFDLGQDRYRWITRLGTRAVCPRVT